MRKSFKQMTRADRISMEALLKAGHKVPEIAKLLNFHQSTIYRELKKGSYIHRNSDYTEEVRYSSDMGQNECDITNAGRGKSLKIGNDIEYANYLEYLIGKKKYSPEAALAEIKKSGKKFKTSISIRTLYRYIEAGVFLTLTNKDLPVKSKRRKKHKSVRVQKAPSKGPCITERPKEIDERNTFGHWEMDTVKGKRGTKSSLLVLTERLTREEIIVKLKDQTAASVVRALDQIERRWGKRFPEVFRTITVDNGVEFSFFEQMQKSFLNKGSRTSIFYCHPYSSYERGSNENQNKLIRRHIPKGTNFDKKTEGFISSVQKWINTYPRKLFDYKCSEELFASELKKIGIKNFPKKYRINIDN